jgi:pantoate--beta-alanine ligase
MTELVRTFADVRDRYRGQVALVPTMGFFHEGHLSLMEAARASASTVVVSLFVNPLQFNDPKDLVAYPRNLERDIPLAEKVGVDVLFVPPPEEMYPRQPAARVVVGGLSDRMEGSHRPGHFEGVATVVAKLFAGLRPDSALFGRKDAQQLAIVTRLAADLSFPVIVSGRPTVREGDGLALSSRNLLLTREDRAVAAEISRGLFAAADAAEAGEREGAVLEGIVGVNAPNISFDYVELASQDDARRLPNLDRPSFLAAAATVGKVRLIDNVSFDLVGGEVVGDRGRRLASPSLLYANDSPHHRF